MKIFKVTKDSAYYSVLTDRGTYTVDVSYSPSGYLPKRDFALIADGVRNGAYGWHVCGRATADTPKAVLHALRSGTADLSQIGIARESA